MSNSNLHALFALRNEHAFARALDTSTTGQAPLSSSAGRKQSHNLGVDVNARDHLGRTVLHLAASNPAPYALSYVKLLLANPATSVNAQDAESKWTALHRALYVGNIAAAILIMQRPETDSTLRDVDGYTPFDLYNETVPGTAPDRDDTGSSYDLFTWGVNRNAALGHGDASDRTHPDQVVIQSTSPPPTSKRFTPVRVRGISMDKLHTTVITDEPTGNLRVCGFGSGGRLGIGQHTQYNLQPVPHLTACVRAVALGQDHTLALTDAGEVFSWGLNRFSQLGYAVEREKGEKGGKGDFSIRDKEAAVQTTPKRVIALKKEKVLGVAACKTASAAWTEEGEVWTWGSNGGQLGYDLAAQPVQVLPRMVTGVQGVTEIALTDTAMCCLIDSTDVVCFRADGRFRVKFPSLDLDFPPYQYVSRPIITRITCDGASGTFGALSSKGDVFTFTPPSSSSFNYNNNTSSPSSSAVDSKPLVKPQRVWMLRKLFDPAVDIALGPEGTLLLCTRAGHVFMRRPGAKVVRVAGVERVVKVCASSTGAYGALRSTPVPPPVKVEGTSLSEDLSSVRPWISGGAGDVTATNRKMVKVEGGREGEEEEEDGDDALGEDITTAIRLCAFLQDKGAPQHQHGADTSLFASSHSVRIPAHRTILAARSPVLRALLAGDTKRAVDGPVRVTRTGAGDLNVDGAHPMAVLLLLEYLYTDDIPALWDRRVSSPLSSLFARVGFVPGPVKTQLGHLASLLDLPALADTLVAPTKRSAMPTLAQDMERLFVDETSKPDVFLELADRTVPAHSIMLRARSLFFRSFFEEEVWTARRWDEGVVRVDLKHMGWKAWSVVVRWLFWGEEELFGNVKREVEGVGELMECLWDVIAVASELLLDKLMLLCSKEVLQHVTLSTASSLLTSASSYNALALVRSLQAYIICNLEALFEGHFLEDAAPDLIKALGAAVRAVQDEGAPATRGTYREIEMEVLMDKCREWVDKQDWPTPVVRSARRESPRLEPVGGKATRRPPAMPTTPLTSPVMRTGLEGDEMFAMDEGVPMLNIGTQSSAVGDDAPPPVWKSTSLKPARVDMKSILAEAETGKKTGSTEAATGAVKWQKMSQRERRKQQAQVLEEEPAERPPPTTSGSPWKTVAAGPSAVSLASTSTTSVPAQRTPQSSTIKAVASTSAVSVSPQRTPQSPATSRVIGAQTPSPVVASKRQPATPGSILQAGSTHGPVFSPTPIQRRTSSDSPAWSRAPVHEAASSPSGLSFAAIQQQQRDRGQQPEGKRSLREIQQEEQARQEEEEFLRWWSAEEQRLKVEEESQVQAVSVTSGKRRRGARSRRGEFAGRGGAGIPTEQ